MAIHWYPGHMHKANKEIKQTLSRINLIIEVLDARIPFSSHNPLLTTLRADKPCIKVLNKSDLADPDMTRQWQSWLELEQGVKTLALTTEQPERMRQLIDLCHKMLADRSSRQQTINTLIMGIPNVGKSSLINILAGKIIARTGNEPAVTKSQQTRSGICLTAYSRALGPFLAMPNRYSVFRVFTNRSRLVALSSTIRTKGRDAFMGPPVHFC